MATPDPNTHPAVLIAQIVIAAGGMKLLDKAVGAWKEASRQRKLQRGEEVPEPKNLQGWLVVEVRALRVEVQQLRQELAGERDAHRQCRVDLARLEERTLSLQADVNELRSHSERRTRKEPS